MPADRTALIEIERSEQPSAALPVGRLALGIHLLTLVGSVVVVAVLDRRLWFFHDDWDPIIFRGVWHGTLSIFAPHNEHWVTLPILLWRALFTVAGLHHYLVFLLPVLLANAALGHALWRVAVRAGAGPWVATPLVLLFLLDGAGYENITWAFQITFVGSVMFGWWAVVLATSRRPTRAKDAAAVLLLIAALMCSGIAVTMTVIAGLAVLLARGWRPALPIVCVPAAVHLVWLYAIGSKGFGNNGSPSVFRDLTKFAGTGLSNVGEQTLGVPGLGAAAVAALIVWAVLRVRATQLDATYAAPIAGVFGVVILFVIISVGRLEGGSAATPRYVHVATAMLLPGIAVALAEMGRAWRVPRLAGCAAAAIVGIHLVATLHETVGVMATYAVKDKQYVGAAVELVRSGRAPLEDAVLLPQGRGYPATAYARLVREGKLALPGPVPRDVLVSEAAILQTSLTTGPVRPLNARILATAELSTTPAGRGCVTITPTGPGPQLAVAVDAGGSSVSLTPSHGGPVVIDLSQPDAKGLFQHAVTIAPGQTAYANFATTLGTARIVLPATGPTKVCVAAR